METFTHLEPKMFSETLVPKGGVILAPTPHTNSKTEDATTTKLCTVIVRHVSTKNQQLDFPNFHRSIVCSCCSIWCLIKSGSKMVKISNASNENEIHRVDSPFNKDAKIYFFGQVGPYFGEKDWPQNLGKWPKTGKPIVMQIREWSVLTYTLCIKIFALIWFSSMLDQIIC